MYGISVKKNGRVLRNCSVLETFDNFIIVLSRGH